MSKFVIAKYIRLSVDDGITESLSIPNQRKILNRFIDELDIPNIEVIEKVDNGHSGTNMERPAVQELLELVRSGGVNMICVKDFSRFSRNAMDSGYFIEQVFPLYGVRFVSVSDDFDSDNYKGDTGGIDVAFKFLVHEYYSVDLSKKVKSALHVKQLRGEPISGTAPFGYRIGESGKWEPDPKNAETVRLIFKLALDGCTSTEIRDSLFQNACPTPSECILMKCGKEIIPKCHWSTDAVIKILKNEQYIGTYISGKQARVTVGSPNCVPTDRSEWVIIPGNHPEFVSKEDFDRVQTEFRKKGKTQEYISRSDNIVVGQTRKRKDGKPLAVSNLYGYVFDKKHRPKINKKPAEAIQLIFSLALEGKTISQICEMLTEAGFPTPGEQNAIDRGEKVKTHKAWTRGAVKPILQNIQYTGCTVSGKVHPAYHIVDGKRQKTSFQFTPKSEWVITQNRRPAIISEDDFNAVQKILAEKPNSKKVERNFLLKYKARCGICGHSLDYDDGVGYPLFRCGHTIGDPTADCHKMKFVAKDIDEVVLTAICKQAKVILKTSKLNHLSAKGDVEQEFSEYENRIAECNENRRRYYESFILHEIDRPKYLKLKSECSDEIERLNKQIAALRAEIQKAKSDVKTAEIAKQAIGKTIPNKELVDVLIDKVIVFPDKRVEIVWKIADFTKNKTGVIKNV